MQKKQSIIRKAKTIGMLLMNLRPQPQLSCNVSGTIRLTDSGTTEAMRQKVGHQPLGNVHGWLADNAEQVIQTLVDPARCHAWKGCSSPAIVGRRSLGGARTPALLMCS